MRSVGNHPPQKLCLERAVALLEEQRGNYNLIDIPVSYTHLTLPTKLEV